MDRETFEKLMKAHRDAQQAVDDQWDKITKTMVAGTLSTTESHPIDQAWVDEYEPLKNARESAELALMDYLRQH